MKGIILTFIFLSFALGHFDVFATTCPTGQTFNTNLNRCMYTEGSVKNREEHSQCEDIENESQKQACMKKAADNRQQSTKDGLNAGHVSASDAQDTGDGNLLTGFSQAWGVVTAVTSATVFVNNEYFSDDSAKSADGAAEVETPPTQEVSENSPPQESQQNNDTCKSCLLLGGVSLYSFYQTKVNQDDVKKKTGELKKEYEEISSDADTMKNAQIAAYDMLEKEQQYVAGVSKKQASQYNTLALGYTAAAGLALYEIWESFGTSCVQGKSFDIKGFTTLSKIKSLFNNPCGVLISSVVTVPAALTVSAQAKKNQKDAESNVVQVQELKEKYVKSVASYCPDGRDDLSNPPCYCYTAEGNKNPNREKSNTCQNFWNRYSGAYVETSDSSRSSSTSSASGCIYSDGKFDRDCNCRKLVNNAGENACQKITVSPGTLSNALGGLDVTEAINASNAATTGTGSTYNASTSDTNAALAGKAIEAIKKQIEAPFKKANGVTLDKVTDSLSKGLSNNGDSNVAIFNGAGAGESLARLRPSSPSIQEAVSSIKSKTNKAQSVIVRKKAGKKASEKKAGNKWRFDDNSSSQVLSFGEGAGDGDSKKRYDYGDNDIIKDKSVSIFKVISHRYVQSGLKKLFEE